MKKYKVYLIFEEDYWPFAYIVKAENFQEALKEASKLNRASDEDIIKVEIVEVEKWWDQNVIHIPEINGKQKSLWRVDDGRS
mgnify:CR=1 FL=1